MPEQKHRRLSKNVGPGHRTGIIPTDKEHDKRVRQVADLLCRGFRKGEIKDAVHNQYGVTARTVENYLAHARTLMLEELQQPRQTHAADAFSFYQSIIKDKEATRCERMQARKRIDDLLGLDAPKRAELSGPEGGPIQTKEENPLKGLSLDRLRQLAAGRIEVGNGKGEKPRGNGE